MPRKKMSFIRFTRFATARKVMERAWASDSLYPAPSWKRTAARFGWKTTLKAAPFFLFYYLARLRRMNGFPKRLKKATKKAQRRFLSLLCLFVATHFTCQSQNAV